MVQAGARSDSGRPVVRRVQRILQKRGKWKEKNDLIIAAVGLRIYITSTVSFFSPSGLRYN